MIGNRKKYALLFLCFCWLGAAFGCAPPPYRIHPEFETRTKNMKALGLLSPDIRIYEFTAGGLRDRRPDWCALGKENVQGALIECFREKPFDVKPLVVDKEMEEEMEDIHALYRAVARSIRECTYGDFKFPGKMKHFDYSIGPIDQILQKHGADGLIFASGFDEISTAGRKALQATAVVVGVLAGVAVVPRSGITVISAALVDPSGAILWYNIKANQGGYDLRERDSATKFIRSVISEYPEATK
ncbi:MAG TPA: hypothetical protein VLZ03_06985 [Thermodesulfobacteriota bacterium]|nr:hypothetical protein [Thermodesulfobacteriota bacterium]